jgi:hypothetical protein
VRLALTARPDARVLQADAAALGLLLMVRERIIAPAEAWASVDAWLSRSGAEWLENARRSALLFELAARAGQTEAARRFARHVPARGRSVGPTPGSHRAHRLRHRRCLMPRGWMRRMHDGAAAVIVLSAGIMIGAWGRSHRADPAALAPTPNAPLAPADTAPPAPPPGGAAGLEAPLIPAAPSFAGSYSVLPGARTAGSPEPPPFPGAPDVPIETPAIAQQAEPASPSSAEPRVKDPPRPRPAQAIPRGIALQSPLLALARPGGRVVLHGLSAGGGPIPAAIEGDWGVIGRCSDRVRIDFAVPAASAGAMRGIGRAEREPEWRVEPVVPTHVCAAATQNYQRPRTPDDTRRVTFGTAGAGGGVAGGGPGRAGRVS